MIPTPARNLLYSTVRLTTLSKGDVTGSGTAFFYQVDVGNGQAIILLITNKHVVEGADSVEAVFHIAAMPNDVEPTGTFETCVIALRDNVLLHPDPQVDLCGINITAHILQSEKAGIFLMRMPAVRETIPEDWSVFDAIEDVLMIGCPNGLYDDANNLPIARRGITATPLSNDYQNQPVFVVDMACFPGSSGSPIYLYNQAGFVDVPNRTFQVGASRLYLVGVLFAGPLITNTGTITMSKGPSFEMSLTMHLGYAVKASAILDLENEVLRRYRLDQGMQFSDTKLLTGNLNYVGPRTAHEVDLDGG